MADGIDWFKNYEKQKVMQRKMPLDETSVQDQYKAPAMMQDIAKQRLLRLHNREEAEAPITSPESAGMTKV